MRKILDNAISGKSVNTVLALDVPGYGGAHYRYGINRPGENSDSDHTQAGVMIVFQNGPTKEFGINGVHNEDLLAILIDRIRGFQSGAFSCLENAFALTKLEEAMLWLKKRTMSRIARGVEGTHTV